jgi:hypothetical protein
MEFCAALMERVTNVKRTATLAELANPAVLAGNLQFLHDAMVGSEQLLRDAAAEADGALADYFYEHLEEERDHVEWLREDLAAGGIPLGPPDPLAMAMVGTQYYLLKHLHPAALLGYLAVTEGDPTPLDTVEQLEAVHGAPLLRCIRYHATADLRHREELFRVIAEVPGRHHALIASSAENALAYLVAAAAKWGCHAGH